MAGLQEGHACVVFLLPGFQVGSSSSQAPGNPTFMFNSDVKKILQKDHKRC